MNREEITKAIDDFVKWIESEDIDLTVDELVDLFKDRINKERGIVFPEPVRLPDGKVESFLVRVNGESFSCTGCGCNVFHKPDKRNLDMYKCNSCGTIYAGSD